MKVKVKWEELKKRYDEYLFYYGGEKPLFKAPEYALIDGVSLPGGGKIIKASFQIKFEAVPDGKYQVNVDRVELTRAQTSGNPMLKWTLRILAPTHKGRLLWRNNVMASNENIKWLKQDLYTCGLQLQKLSDLPGHLEQLLNIKLEVTKRTRGENENIYFNRRIVMADDAEVIERWLGLRGFIVGAGGVSDE